MSALYSFHDVFKSYDEGGKTLEILKGVNMDIAEGEQLAIVGASGSGKSTLLHLMGALDSPSAGSVLFQGRDMADLSPDEQARFRNKTCGYGDNAHRAGGAAVPFGYRHGFSRSGMRCRGGTACRRNLLRSSPRHRSP